VTLANGMIFDIYQGIGATERGSNSPLNAIGRGIASVFPGLTMNDDTKASIDGASLVAEPQRACGNNARRWDRILSPLTADVLACELPTHLPEGWAALTRAYRRMPEARRVSKRRRAAGGSPHLRSAPKMSSRGGDRPLSAQFPQLVDSSLVYPCITP
jgi:hypothetical protein